MPAGWAKKSTRQWQTGEVAWVGADVACLGLSRLGWDRLKLLRCIGGGAGKRPDLRPGVPACERASAVYREREAIFASMCATAESCKCADSWRIGIQFSCEPQSGRGLFWSVEYAIGSSLLVIHRKAFVPSGAHHARTPTTWCVDKFAGAICKAENVARSNSNWRLELGKLIGILRRARGQIVNYHWRFFKIPFSRRAKLQCCGVHTVTRNSVACLAYIFLFCLVLSQFP